MSTIEIGQTYANKNETRTVTVLAMWNGRRPGTTVQYDVNGEGYSTQCTERQFAVRFPKLVNA